MNRRTLLLSSMAAILAQRHAHAQTPVAQTQDFAAAAERFGEFAAMLPANLPDSTDLNVSWMDLARQRAAFGIDDQTGDLPPTIPLLTDGHFFMMVTQWDELLGFTFSMLDQLTVYGLPPYMIRIFRFNTDVTSAIPVWLEHGYEHKESRQGEYWTIGEEYEFDVQNPVSRTFLAHANNIAFVDDQTLIMSTGLKLLDQTRSVIAGKGTSVAEVLEDSLAVLPEDAINAATMGGSPLNIAQVPMFVRLLEESDAEVGPMPAILDYTAGVTEGAAKEAERQLPDARAYMLLRTEGGAEQAARVVDWRWRNMTSDWSSAPYVEFTEVSVEAIDADMVQITAGGDAAGQNLFWQLMIRFDVAPFFFIEGD